MIESPIFWLLLILLIALTLWALWRPLYANSKFEMQSIAQRNIAIARERGKEIESAFDVGELSVEEHKLAKQDLELALADELASSMELSEQFNTTSTASNLIILALIPMLAIGSYLLTSNYQSRAAQAALSAEANSVPSFEEVIKQLEEAVEANPEDQQGLYLLAKSYAQLQQYSESAKLYRQLIALAEPNADLLANFADVSAMANNQHFTTDIVSTLDQALELDPEHITALWLAGLAKQQLGQPERALRHWQKLKPLIAENNEASGELAILINNVSIELGPRAKKILAEFVD